MDSSVRTTRRQLVARALGVGGLRAAGPTVAALLSAAPSPAATPPKTDADLLYELLAVELLVTVVYTKVIQSGVLSARGYRLASELLVYEQAHVRVLTLELRNRGGAAPASPESTSAIDELLAATHVSGSLAKLKDEHDGIRLLLGVETMAEGAYYKAMSMLRNSLLLRTAAEIMGSEAQHYTVLSEVLHPGDIARAVPYAFVE
jgi:hypothetical protein